MKMIGKWKLVSDLEDGNYRKRFVLCGNSGIYIAIIDAENEEELKHEYVTVGWKYAKDIPRYMSRKEVGEWSRSLDSVGWVVKYNEWWEQPAHFGYTFPIGKYKKAKWDIDNKCVMESTITKFYKED